MFGPLTGIPAFFIPVMLVHSNDLSLDNATICLLKQIKNFYTVDNKSAPEKSWPERVQGQAYNARPICVVSENFLMPLITKTCIRDKEPSVRMRRFQRHIYEINSDKCTECVVNTKRRPVRKAPPDPNTIFCRSRP